MSHTSDYVIAIDLGSSGPKVSLVSDRGELVASTSRRTTTINTPDGGGEQDPEEWWCTIRDCVRKLVETAGIPRERIVAISCATQWSVTVPVDKNGRHLMNAIHWTDSRGAPYSQQITDGRIKVAGYGLTRMLRWIKITGGVPAHSGADALSHILYLKHARPDIYRETATLLEPMDYINLRLTGAHRGNLCHDLSLPADRQSQQLADRLRRRSDSLGGSRSRQTARSRPARNHPRPNLA